MRLGMRRLKPGDLDLELIIAAVGVVLVIGVAVLRIVPQKYVPSQPCTFHRITGYPCLTCGGTRAARSLGRLEVGRALASNPLVAIWLILALPHALWVAASRIWQLPRPRLFPESRRDRYLMWGGVVLLVLANWAYLVYAGI
jgi:hypothetical protein